MALAWPDGAQRHAIAVAISVVAAAVIDDVKMVTEFGPEYGFAFKRLPVYRIPLANRVTVFVDPADGAIAAVIDNADRAEGWVFGYIHKLDWLVPFTGTDLRDALAMTLAVLLSRRGTAGTHTQLAGAEQANRGK